MFVMNKDIKNMSDDEIRKALLKDKLVPTVSNAAKRRLACTEEFALLMLNDENPTVRCVIAMNGFGLDVLKYDKDSQVCRVLMNHNPEYIKYFLDHKNYIIRDLAEKFYYHFYGIRHDVGEE